jgi:adenylosuccinate synthase
MGCTIVAGGQWGDEAKGKFASYLALEDDFDLVARAGDGPGAGHTVIWQGQECKMRQIPCGFINESSRLLMGAGVLVGVETVLREIETYRLHGRVGIDFRASVIEPSHISNEGNDHHLKTIVQTTGSGHGPCMAARAMRIGRLTADAEALKPYLTDVAKEVNDALDRGGSVLVEGTGGYLLSVLYGTYPYVVGKDLTAATFAADIGVGPSRVDQVVLAFKAFPTRVGPGPFATELDQDEVDRRGFVEFATVTKRRRRVGEFDFALARDAVRVNHPDYLAISFLDRIDPDSRGKSYQELSRPARDFIARIEDELGVAVGLIGTGPETRDIIDRRSQL